LGDLIGKSNGNPRKKLIHVKVQTCFNKTFN